MSIAIVCVSAVMILLCFCAAREVREFESNTDLIFFLYLMITIIALAFMFCIIYITVH